MSKVLVVYTMKGCSHCDDFKNMLKENNIEYHNRDIDEHEEEYNLFTELTNDFVPAFMVFEEETEKVEYFAPELNYDTLEEAIEIVKKTII